MENHPERKKNLTVMSYVTEAVFLYCCSACPCCPANAIQMGQAPQAIWPAMKKHLSAGWLSAATALSTAEPPA